MPCPSQSGFDTQHSVEAHPQASINIQRCNALPILTQTDTHRHDNGFWPVQGIMPC